MDPEALARLEAERRRWEATTLREALAARPERRERFSTISDVEVGRLYTPADVADLDYLRDLGFPGEYPFTRGIHPTMYRGRLWTMRQFAGFGTPEESNRRFHYLLRLGQTGLSVAFDMPTLMGYDADHPRAQGEVGREGVAVSSLADMEVLFEGIPLDEITTSMTINAPANVLLAMYVAVADRRGIPRERLGGTTQTDILKEFIAQKEWIVPPRASMKLVQDMLVFGARELPRWNVISISGYHIREAGATAAQELAFTLADGIAYVQAGIDAGLDVDAFAPRLSFFFDCHIDFFEEIAKFRAARRMWARIMRERFGARNPRAWWLRFHTQTAGVSLTAQQPLNNIVRVALQALAAVLGGTQSLHTNSMDETYALPTEEAVTVALRTQQIIAYETGVADTVDPLGGAYYVEALTRELERQAWAYIERIDALGGMVAAVEAGYPQREIAEAAYRYQQQLERGEKIIVGVNAFVDETPRPIPILRIDPEVERRQVERLRRVRAERDPARVAEALHRLREAARRGDNTMYPILDAVKAYATVGEICDVFRAVYGEYREPAII
ncbi:MAG: methylmalonyl-CoA mutase family protein [Armatimonadota bacterium]|nr:methylmalonyl-CoA mutase family protein [Armatimonadota bacterium]MDR7447634.1 methylmalonyl-CoA mutase family protein [Armatimonadota bacterium]MDR7459485.1 methylmalonyl-CoA mutase family protein [Armatimonadota bacterium]MDR7480071.1 methylmalonyl-CoA mutase family protein [Armatimonadota bacterium]MDR7488798.1 methylmalonyl-CoA mutase family protein [Armatimonadota bacterium]